MRSIYHFLSITFIFIVTFACYSNSLYGDWAYDDNFAVVNNKDVLPSTPLSTLLYHDFWGQDISKPDSHKSYRPLTILTFRLNYLFHGMDTYGYHLVNVILHCVVSVMVYYLAHVTFEDGGISLLSGVLFGLHPVHTEGVSSIVGRAEPLCAVFYLAGLFSYELAMTSGRWWMHGIYITFYVLSTIAKETGYTVLGVMLCHNFLILPYQKRTTTSSKQPRTNPLAMVTMLGCCGLVYVGLRAWLTSTFILHNYRHLENPIAFASDRLTRTLSSGYLHTRYLSILLFPFDLSVDYSFNAIPLVESLLDPRNMSTIVAYTSLVGALLLTLYGAYRKIPDASRVLCLLLFGVFSFIPASNIFFYVGTMLAERLLYIPSIPFCILIAWGAVRTARTLHSLLSSPWLRYSLLALALLSPASLCGWYAWRTHSRNIDWKGEHELFMNALQVCPGSAKVWQSVGVLHRRSQNWTQAIDAFSKARSIEPNYCEIDYWLGITYLNMGQTERATNHLQEAVSCIYVRVQSVTALNKVYEVLISVSPNNPTYLINWAKVLDEIGQTHDSASYFLQASIMLHNQGLGNSTIPLLQHTIALIYEDSPESFTPSLSSKDDIACSAHMWLGAAYLGLNNLSAAAEHMRNIAGMTTFLSSHYYSPTSTPSSPAMLSCETLEKHGRQALAGLYISQIKNGKSVDARTRLELAVLLVEAGNVDSGLYQYYEAASALSTVGDFVGAHRVITEALENTKKNKDLPAYKQLSELHNNLSKFVNNHQLKSTAIKDEL